MNEQPETRVRAWFDAQERALGDWRQEAARCRRQARFYAALAGLCVATDVVIALYLLLR